MNTNGININNRLLPPSISQAEQSLDSDEEGQDSPIYSDEEREETYNEEELFSNGYRILATTMPTVDKNVKNIKLIEKNRELLEFLIEFRDIRITINVLPSNEAGEEFGHREIYFNKHRILISAIPAKNNVINTRELEEREFLIEFKIFIVITIDY
ncbi:unnamed protein product [Rhizophagus irregularis]|uniref:Uncharacterized protein n=1 Tax=Rhizophagus irregularis TaxID=588596 RepID=A0A2N1N2J2_9GLOM|nr:hypothetical protein RhiirC2_713656 [Rhizophagus irregularis]CAB4380576.1 unnamed protein product [Rhizophagus irregularis]CAB5373338.1 unnamed protein product [Rhizophagus irregularis]